MKKGIVEALLMTASFGVLAAFAWHLINQRPAPAKPADESTLQEILDYYSDPKVVARIDEFQSMKKSGLAVPAACPDNELAVKYDLQCWKHSKR